jgi:hypothetical protein
MTITDSGYIYCLYNESFKTSTCDDSTPFYQIKIGHTKGDRTAYDRAKELSTSSGLPTPFKVVRSVVVYYPREVERLLHNYFKDRRVSSNREFFWFSEDQFDLITSLTDRYDDAVSDYQRCVFRAPLGIWEDDPHGVWSDFDPTTDF